MESSAIVETFTAMTAELEHIPQLCELMDSVWGRVSTSWEPWLRQTIAHQTCWITILISNKLILDDGPCYGRQRVVAAGSWDLNLDAEKYLDMRYEDDLPFMTKEQLSVEIDRVWGGTQQYEAGKSIKPGAYLHNFAVMPTYQRRGLGGALLDYSLEKIDKLMLPCIVNSSDVGLRLYEQHGFSIMKGLPWLDMIRPARGVQGDSQTSSHLPCASSQFYEVATLVPLSILNIQMLHE